MILLKKKRDFEVFLIYKKCDFGVNKALKNDEWIIYGVSTQNI